MVSAGWAGGVPPGRTDGVPPGWASGAPPGWAIGVPPGGAIGVPPGGAIGVPPGGVGGAPPGWASGVPPGTVGGPAGGALAGAAAGAAAWSSAFVLTGLVGSDGTLTSCSERVSSPPGSTVARISFRNPPRAASTVLRTSSSSASRTASSTDSRNSLARARIFPAHCPTVRRTFGMSRGPTTKSTTTLMTRTSVQPMSSIKASGHAGPCR